MRYARACFALSLGINAENHARILLSVFCIFALTFWLDFAKRPAIFSQKCKAKFLLQSQKIKTTKSTKTLRAKMWRENAGGRDKRVR